MVATLGPGKFYGSSLPRPRYTKFDTDRVDPPVPVLDSLLSWANEAHWSMGGLSFDRLRHQGRIEGNVKKLREEKEKIAKNRRKRAASVDDLKNLESHVVKARLKREDSVSPPRAPMAKKRRRFMALIDEDEDENHQEEETVEKHDVVRVRKSMVRKLDVEFEKVASKEMTIKPASPNFEDGDYDDNLGKARAGLMRSKMMKAVGNMNGKSNNVASRTRDKSPKNIGEQSLSPPVNAVRTSPRLLKNRQANLI